MLTKVQTFEALLKSSRLGQNICSDIPRGTNTHALESASIFQAQSGVWKFRNGALEDENRKR